MYKHIHRPVDGSPTEFVAMPTWIAAFATLPMRAHESMSLPQAPVPGWPPPPPAPPPPPPGPDVVPPEIDDPSPFGEPVPVREPPAPSPPAVAAPQHPSNPGPSLSHPRQSHDLTRSLRCPESHGAPSANASTSM